ncbi:MAG: hypothetical protein ACREU7_00270 [Burkholderiales bacterium]
MSAAEHTSGEPDLFCLRCGYNLRGLAGDPVRCPECSYANRRSDLAEEGTPLRKRLRKIETWILYGIVAFFVVGFLFLVAAVLAGGRIDIATAISLLLCVFLGLMFARLSRKTPR